jgi:biotin operon repressor
MTDLSPEQAARVLYARLLERRPQIEESIFARVRAIEDSTGASGRRYTAGLQPTISAGLDYGLASIELARDGTTPEVPAQLLVQARVAARSGVSMDTVLRRYCGANTLFFDVLIEEAERGGLSQGELKRFYRTWSSSFEHLLAAVSDEYGREQARANFDGSDRRRVKLVERLLAGELLDTSELSYSFDCWHLSLLASGAGAESAIRDFAADIDRALLLIHRDPETLWAWLGSRRPFDVPRCREQFAALELPPTASIALGEPAEGLAGWRLSHRQAAATLQVALRSSEPVLWYSQMPLLASTLQDDLLAASLDQLYLAPLRTERDGGEAAKQTLRAYFAASGNASSAAAALGVSRHTVRSRITSIEDKIGRPIDSVSAEIETALSLDEIEPETESP